MTHSAQFLKHMALLLLGFGAFPLSAQKTVRGTVKDALTLLPLSGVHVHVAENAKIGTVTDSAGAFRLPLPDGKTYTLEASCVGYETQRRKVSGENCTFLLDKRVYALASVVVTGTRTPKLLTEAPVLTRVIGEEEIRNADVPDVQGLLETTLPGIEFTYSMNQQTSLNLQGFGGNSVLFLVDGERLAGETLDNVDYSRLNLDNVSRIEIVKGAASSLYGSNAVGGVVNLISKENRDPWNVLLNGRYGSHNNRQFGGSLSFKNKRFNQMLNAQYSACDAIALKNEGDYNLIYAHQSRHVKEQLKCTFNQHFSMTAKAGYFFRERESQETARERYRDFNGGLKGVLMTKGGHDLKLSYVFDQYDKSDYTLRSGLDIRDYSNVQHSVRGVYNHYFSKKHILTAGGDYQHDYLMTYQFKEGGSFRQHTADFFTQFDWTPLEKVNILSALRYDAYSEAQVRHLSPKLAVLYKLPRFSLRASYADGFRAPTLKELFMQFNMANIFMIYGNRELKSERSHNFNAAAEYFHKTYNVTVMGFYNRVSDRITTVWNQSLNGMQYVNMAPLRISGLDVNASAKWVCGLGLRLSYVYTHERLPQGAPAVSATRPHTATVNLSYGKKWPDYAFTATLSGRALSKVTCEEYTGSSYEETAETTYPGYTIWKFSLSQCVMRGLNIHLSVDNMFNYVPEYYYSNSPATTGTVFAAGCSLDVARLCGKGAKR